MIRASFFVLTVSQTLILGDRYRIWFGGEEFLIRDVSGFWFSLNKITEEVRYD